MAKATKTAPNTTRAPAAKKDGDQAETSTTKGVQMSTVTKAPKPDADRAPREDGYGRKERQTPKADINAEDEGTDKVYGVASRARWGGSESIHKLSQDAAAAEASAAENEE